ncbi:MAG: response regulator [Candidatus Didemnitutus sp.]|nr:response regulator [Candidatus Didemnitutus sp.]
MNLLLEAPLPVSRRYQPQPSPLSQVVVTKRILIADDDAAVRASLAAVLELEGFVVDEAVDGIAAVKRVVEHKYDLVLLDLNMSRWDGWTAFIQMDWVLPLLPVIVITARPDQYGHAVRLGVDAFMEKPLDISMLLEAIATLVNEASARHISRVTDRKFITRCLPMRTKEFPQ